MTSDNQAPDLIWAFHAPELAEDNCGGNILAHDEYAYGGQEYTRSDILDAKDAENKRLREALETIRDTKPHHAGQTVNEYHFQQIAQAALAEGE